MYVYGNPDDMSGGMWSENDSSQVQLLFRFGKDDQYYEIRQPIYEGWDQRNHIDLNIKELTNYKLDITLEEYEDVGLDGCSSEYETGFGNCLESICYNSETQDYYNADLSSECDDDDEFLDNFSDYCEESNFDFSVFINGGGR